MFTSVAPHVGLRPLWLIGHLVLLLALSTAQAQTNPARAKLCNLAKGVAIQGYDPVGYLANHKATIQLTSISS